MTPQKFITVPLLVEAVQWNGRNHSEIVEWSGYKLEAVCDRLYIGYSNYIKPSGWVVRQGENGIRLLENDEFEAQYTPFKEELKDYPTSTINNPNLCP